jgi:hypothetical protein
MLILVASLAHADGLRHFNAHGVFGKSVDESVILLLPSDRAAIQPLTIMTDVKDGKYYAATVTFPETVTLSQARASLNELYQESEKSEFADDPEIGLWRIEKHRFAIQLSRDEKGTKVIYITFQPTENILKSLKEHTGHIKKGTEQGVGGGSGELAHSLTGAPQR